MKLVEIVSTQTIRPASPTPDQLKSFSLSIFDQLAPPMYVPLILFYRGTGGISVQKASDLLKDSLSETLTRFFPLAGRIRDNICVDCTDEGIQYTVARVKGSKKLRDILAPPKLEALGQLLPTECGSVSSTEARRHHAVGGRLLLVQASVFECGGIAIGICFSHKLVDAATISLFLKSWTASARGSSSNSVVAPDLSLGSQFPPSDSFATSSPVDQLLLSKSTQKSTLRRFVFSGSKMAALKTESSSHGVSHPTRIEAVSSLIWQCAMRSSALLTDDLQSSKVESYGVSQTVNLRSRVDPPMPECSFGNLVGFYATRADSYDKASPWDLPSLVAKMRDAKEEYMQGNVPKELLAPESFFSKICETLKRGVELMKEKRLRMYLFSSWCKFELYELADFGWGKPIWTSIYHLQGRDSVVLLDTRDGEGIEAWLCLPEDEMVLFEQDQQLLSFASQNPNVLDLSDY